MRVLLTDDDPSYRALVADILTRLDMDVLQAASCAGAWRHIQRVPEVLLFCDHRLPDGDGIGLARRLRDAGRRDRFILMTGMVDAALVAEARAAGIDDVMEKPLSLGDLERHMEALVGDAV